MISSSSYQIIMVKIRHNLILEHIVTHFMCHPMKLINKSSHFSPSLLCKSLSRFKAYFSRKNKSELYSAFSSIIRYYTRCLNCNAFKEILKIRNENIW